MKSQRNALEETSSHMVGGSGGASSIFSSSTETSVGSKSSGGSFRQGRRELFPAVGRVRN